MIGKHYLRYSVNGTRFTLGYASGLLALLALHRVEAQGVTDGRIMTEAEYQDIMERERIQNGWINSPIVGTV